MEKRVREGKNKKGGETSLLKRMLSNIFKSLKPSKEREKKEKQLEGKKNNIARGAGGVPPRASVTNGRGQKTKGMP